MKTTFAVFLAILFIVGCTSLHRFSVVVVETSSSSLDIPLSEVRFSKIDIVGTPRDIGLQINRAMKAAGFPVGVTISGHHASKKTHLKMRNVTMRQAVDQMCVQLKMSYWDNARLRELYVINGETSAFRMDLHSKDGKYTPAGPPRFMPPGFASLPLREAYFDRTIEDLNREPALRM